MKSVSRTIAKPLAAVMPASRNVAGMIYHKLSKLLVRVEGRRITRSGEPSGSAASLRIERTHGTNDVDIPMSPELSAACDAMSKAHLTYIVTTYGKPRSKYGLGNDFAKWATEAGLPARCRLHGLKKGGMRRIAEAGGTPHELMAVSGHRTLSEVQRYTADADRKVLADSGMAKLRGQSVNAGVANRVPASGKPGLKTR